MSVWDDGDLPIDCVISDDWMAGLDGLELHDHVTERRPTGSDQTGPDAGLKTIRRPFRQPRLARRPRTCGTHSVFPRIRRK